MAIRDIATNALFLRAAAAVTLLLVARFLYRGYVSRSRVRSLKAQGIPILPHSLLFGHLPIFQDFRAEHPPDVNIYVFHTWLIKNCQKYFPGLDYPPPIVYMDLWPAIGNLALVFDPVAVSQFTQTKNLPKDVMMTDFLEPLTQKNDIVCTEGQAWKTWRSRFNPGFSQRNLMAMLPEIMEEVVVFVDGLARLAGRGESWGPMFQLEAKTTNLTFDVICRAALDMRLHEQSRQSSSPLKKALLDQLSLMSKQANAARALPIGRMPWDNAAIRRNNRTMRNVLLPQIEKKLESDVNDSQKKTVVDLAIKYVDKDQPGAAKGKPSAEFVDRLIANLKVFLFAGHDTTASTICFMTKELLDHPDCLAKLRDEHDSVLGPDPDSAVGTLTASPHLLHALPYTLGVIKETLRLHPLAATMREADKDFSVAVPGSPTRYPLVGFAAWLSPHGCQRHPGYWPRPGEFLPERWLAVEGEALYSAKEAWTPFSVGPRNCIGLELAQMELKLVAVLMCRKFDIEEAWEAWDEKQGSRATPSYAVDGQRLYAAGSGTVHPKDGMPVRLRLRK